MHEAPAAPATRTYGTTHTLMKVHDGNGTPRDGDLASAARTRALSLWLDPLVRDSCGDALAPVPSLALTVLKQVHVRHGAQHMA